MTTSPQQPHSQAERTRYNPITVDQLPQPGRNPLTRPVSSFFSGPLAEPVNAFESPVARCVAAPLLGFIALYTQHLPLVSPVLILILLGCVIARMEGPVARIAAVPLALSAIKLSFAIMSNSVEERLIHQAPQNGGFQPGLYWLPIFFSACLALIRDKETVTFKLIFVGSCILLASGLLPSVAFIGIFYMLDVLLFFGVTIAIFMDMSGYLRRQGDQHSTAAS